MKGRFLVENVYLIHIISLFSYFVCVGFEKNHSPIWLVVFCEIFIINTSSLQFTLTLKITKMPTPKGKRLLLSHPGLPPKTLPTWTFLYYTLVFGIVI